MIDLIRSELRRAMAPFDALVQLVTDVEWRSLGVAIGRGARGEEVAGDAAITYGVYARPPDGAEAIVLRFGGLTLFVGYRLRSAEPTMEAGEVGLQDDQNQRVMIRRQRIEIEGQEVVMVGGTHGAARLGDGVDASPAFTTWLGTLVTAINTLGGAVTPFGGSRIASVAEGSTKVKVG